MKLAMDSVKRLRVFNLCGVALGCVFLNLAIVSTN